MTSHQAFSITDRIDKSRKINIGSIIDLPGDIIEHIYQERTRNLGDTAPPQSQTETPLLAYELSSVCRKKILQHPIIEAELLQALVLGLSLDIQWVDVDQRAVVELAIERNLTTCDATFLWVSNQLGLPLLTFDERLQAASN